MDEDTVLKTVGVNTFVGSIPTASAIIQYVVISVVVSITDCDSVRTSSNLVLQPKIKYF
jgi:hypothetical protein